MRESGYSVWVECDGRIIMKKLRMIYVAYGRIVLETGGVLRLYAIDHITWTPGGIPNYIFNVTLIGDAPDWAVAAMP
jgi:hypothetical protein